MPHLRYRSLPGIRAAELSAPSPADLDLISREFSPQPVTADDVHVRQARVAHNQHDRTLERFPKAYLERFAETLPGKSLLPGHDTRALPLGRWFRAETRTRTEDFPVVVTQGKALEAEGGKAAEIVPGMETQRTRVTWLESAFYFSNDPSTEGFRKNLDTGVYQDVSIGFSYDDLDCDICRKSYFSDCPHWRGQRLEDGRTVTLTYSGDPKQVEARETSLVYLGAQQHAELVKALKSGTVDPHALAATPLGEDLAALKEFEALARIYGHQQKSWAFPGIKVAPFLAAEPPLSLSDDGEKEPPVGGDADPTTPAESAHAAPAPENDSMNLKERLQKALGLSDTATEDEVVSAVERAQKAAQSLEGVNLSALKSESEQAKAFQPLAEIGKAALADLKTAILADDLKVTGKESPALAEVVDLLVEKGSYARLREIAAEKHAAVLAHVPAGQQGDPSLGREDLRASEPNPGAAPQGRIPHPSEYSVL